MLNIPCFNAVFTPICLAVRTLSVVCCVWGFGESCLLASPCDTLPPVSTSLIDQLAREARDSFAAPGFAIGIVKDGEVIFNEGYGVLELGKATPVNEQTLFAIASNTKAFIGTAAAMLAADGALDLDSRVSEHLPYLRFADDNVTALANVTDLMTHRIGLGTFEGDHLWFKRQLTPKQVLTKVENMPLRYPFRAGFGYSNLGFIAAGEIISKSAGKSWNEVLETRIFEPLNMSRTVTRTVDLPMRGNYASGHITRQQNTPIPAVAWDTPGAAGGIWSSTTDMLKWVSCNLNGGVMMGDTIWPAEVQGQVWKPHNTYGNSQSFASYGLGWFMGKIGDHTIYRHGGGYDGMYSQVQLVPDLNLGIVVLTNSMTGLASTLSAKVRDLYLEQPNPTWLADAMNRERRGNTAWFARQDSVDMQLAAQRDLPQTEEVQVGKYVDPIYGTFEVSAVGDGYELEFPDAHELTAVLTPAGGNTYALVWKSPHAWYEKGLVRLERLAGTQLLRLYIPNDDIFYNWVAAEYVGTDQR